MTKPETEEAAAEPSEEPRASVPESVVLEMQSRFYEMIDEVEVAEEDAVEAEKKAEEKRSNARMKKDRLREIGQFLDRFIDTGPSNLNYREMAERICS